MPKIDGVGMFKLLRAIPEWRQVPILAVTAYGQEEAQRAILAGADQSMAQPVEADHLLTMVSELLKSRQQHTRNATMR